MTPGRRTRIAPLFAAMAIVFGCTCSPRNYGPMPELVPPAWQDGETALYDITRNDTVLYRSRMTVQFDEEVSRPGASSTDTAIVVATIVATNVIEPVQAETYFFDSVTVTMRRADLRPLRSYRSLATDISDIDVSARFETGRAFITKGTVDGVQEDVLPLPERSFSNDAIQTMLRAVPLVPGTVFRIDLVLAMDLRTTPVTVTVLGTKVISTVLGDIMCREVQLAAPGREARFWYELAEPHRFVGMHDQPSETRVIITSWRPPGPDSLTQAAP